MTVTDRAPRGGPATVLYSVYAWTIFTLLLTFALLGATLLPGLSVRRRWVSAFARWFFHVAGLRVEVRGADRLPESSVIVVANHASYLDGPLLQAFLPPRFGYVIKSEMQKVPLAGFMLRRIGSRFVERFSASASARDARALLRAASGGEALGFFPEGTFNREPGLCRFRAGAFLTAVKAAVPTVPIAIHGSRTVLPAGTWLVRREPIVIEILTAIPPDDNAYGNARELTQVARQRVLDALDEPDLLCDV